MMRFLARLRTYDWPLIVAISILCAVGFAAIYSVDLSRGETLIFFPTQLLAFGIGMTVFFVASGLHMRLYQGSATAVYVFSILLLIGVLLFGETIRGTRGWFRFAGFSFQPAEFAKVGLVIVLGWLVARYGRRFDTPQFVIATGLFTALGAGLILLQPDLGSAVVLMGLWFFLLLMAGTKKRYIGLLVLAGLTAFLAGWFFFFADYQRDRLLTFIDPGRDPLGSGYNVSQSIIAIGSGQLLGRGLGFGSQSQLHFLPEAQTDFIFSVIAEELGFVGAMLLLILFGVVLWRLLRIARLSRSEFGAYVVLGVAIILCLQLVLNVGGALGVLPLTGVTLPFVSYGGSSLIINLLLIGVVQSIAASSIEHEGLTYT